MINYTVYYTINEYYIYIFLPQINHPITSEIILKYMIKYITSIYSKRLIQLMPGSVLLFPFLCMIELGGFSMHIYTTNQMVAAFHDTNVWQKAKIS